MKITQARELYATKVKQYREQKQILTERKAEIEQLTKRNKRESAGFENEMVIIELQYQALEEKQTEYREYMSRLTEFETAYMNMLNVKEQGDAVSDAYEDIGKIMEVARRIMRGDIVPVSDEKKLMEYSDELYQAAKNIGELMRQKEREKHKSLWEDEKAQNETQDIMEQTGEMEAPQGPEIQSPLETMAAAESDLAE